MRGGGTEKRMQSRSMGVMQVASGVDAGGPDVLGSGFHKYRVDQISCVRAMAVCCTRKPT